MAIQSLFERYVFPENPKLNTVLQDFRRKTNEIIDATIDFGNLKLYGSTPPRNSSIADTVQLWLQDRSAGRASLYYRAEGGEARPLIREFDVSDYGLVPNNNSGSIPANNVKAWNILISKTAAGDKIYFPTGIWYINDELAVSQEVTIYGNGEGSEIQQETDEKRGFNVTASNVTIKDLRLYGFSAPGASEVNAKAIEFLGTAAGGGPTNLVNVKVIDCFIENWGQYGIYANYIDNFEFSGNYIKSITYAGILVLSAQDGIIDSNRIDDIKGDSGSGNSYGISVTRSTGGGLTEFPRSARIAIVNNVVTNAPLWDGISTHAADSCFFNNNIVKDTKRGINCVSDGTNASLNNTISNNTVDIGSITAGTGSSGIGFAGADASNLATGCIVGNVIIGHGDEDSVISGGLSLVNTQGVSVTGNRLINCASRGIMIYNTNYDFVVSGNTISDVWSATHNVIAIMSNSTNNVGYIGENSWANVTKSSGFYLGSGTSYGIFINNQAGTAISLGNNKHTSADTYISDSGNKIANQYIVSQINQERAAIACANYMTTYATAPTVASALYLRTSDSDLLGTLNATEDGDILGTLYFQGVRSANDLFTHGAYIRATQNGAAGTQLPTDLKFVTYTDTTSNLNHLVLGTGGNVNIGTATVNTLNTKGLTINMGGADDEILSLKSSDVAHGITDEGETDTFGLFKKGSPTEGGYAITGLTSGGEAFKFIAYYTDDNTTKTTAARAPIECHVFKKSGTGAGDVGANANLFIIRARVGGSSETKFIIDEDGDALADGTHGTYQDHDDIELLAELEVNLDKSKKLKSKNKYKKKDLEDLGILKPFLSTKGLNMLLMGAVRQLSKRVKTLETQI